MPKSMREDYRYLTLKVDKELNSRKASEILEESVKSYAGDRGMVQADPKVIVSESDFADSQMMARINSDSERLFRAAIVLSDTKICTLDVSGSSS